MEPRNVDLLAAAAANQDGNDKIDGCERDECTLEERQMPCRQNEAKNEGENDIERGQRPALPGDRPQAPPHSLGTSAKTATKINSLAGPRPAPDPIGRRQPGRPRVVSSCGYSGIASS